MKVEDLEKAILKKHPELIQSNFKYLLKEHLEALLNDDKVTLTRERLIKIFVERNEKAETNKRLNETNFGLNSKLKSLNNKLKSFTDLSKSEIIQGFKKLFGKVTKDDDEILNEIGATSNESVREDLEKAEEVINQAQDIANKYPKKYDNLSD